MCGGTALSPKTTSSDTVQCQVVERQCLRSHPSDGNIKKDWINVIFNEDPDHVSKNLVFCLLHFTADLFTNKAIRSRIFKKIETKRGCCADYIGSDSNVTTQAQVTLFIKWSLLLCLLNRSFDMYWVICVFDLNHSSVRLWGMNVCCQTYTTVIQS